MRNQPTDTWLISKYKKHGQIPLLWQWRAREFVCAANNLRGACDDKTFFNATSANRHSKPHNAARLLYGLALEMLLKALLVAQGADATSSGKLNKRLKTHNLVELWSDAGLLLTPQTKDTLEILHWAIESGKYPVGTKPESNAPGPYTRPTATV